MSIWRQIKKHPNYEISNDGYVRNIRTGDILSSQLSCSGYNVVRLDGDTVYVGHLVLEAFEENIGDISEQTCIMHIDGDKRNDNIYNLRYSTKSEIVLDGYRKGIRKNNFEAYNKKRHNEAVTKERGPCKVVDISNGVVYDSIDDCSSKTGLTIQSIRASINGSYQIRGMELQWIR